MFSVAKQMWLRRCFTVHVVLDPGEGDRSLSAALAEPEQERPRTLVAQQSLLPLLADEAHDGAAATHFSLNPTLYFTASQT